MRTVPVSELAAQVDYGVTASASKDPIGPKMLRITDLQETGVDWSAVPHCSDTTKGVEARRLKVGDIVFARTGSTGNSLMIRECPDGAVFASYLIRLRVQPEVADPGYVSHFFRSPGYWRQITSASAGGVQKGVNASKLKRLLIPLPPIEEQRRIAEVLDATAALRTKRRQALAKLRDLTQAVFVDMFGKWHAAERGQLEQYVDVVTKGTTPTSVGFKFTESGVPFVRVQDLVAGSVAIDRIELFVSEETNKALARSILLPNDVLISIAGTIGRVALVPRDAPTLNCNQAVALVRTGQDLEPVYLAAWLNTPEAQAQMMGSRVTGTISNLSLANIRSLRVPVPAIDRQRRFAAVVGEIEILRDSLSAHADTLDTLFGSLQQRAFRGEL
ncbi:MAG: hypothetical protein F4Y27_04370 [Acidimicrobiaceae bacterium]|nr:hypothetical protein [Acidimicrobiaceae bacterium]MYA73891.1 hypothetical protein [Acidimicrobiaceae bacterium]MYD05957.1 hypothetical protein [Acidimicrobiaceae bacterium]MYG54916.1 hypothetical protein [Acidimicrobiaceae bacterium]MYI58622.1 hypothetical protein [Acidimicrobiaceae bacterium]